MPRRRTPAAQAAFETGPDGGLVGLSPAGGRRMLHLGTRSRPGGAAWPPGCTTASKKLGREATGETPGRRSLPTLRCSGTGSTCLVPAAVPSADHAAHLAALGAARSQDPGVPTRTIAQDPAADGLLGRDPLALLIGMLLPPSQK